ncbi:MAG: hypothetical protein V3W37_05850, partial [Candidatus Binatia bacterium]
DLIAMAETDNEVSTMLKGYVAWLALSVSFLTEQEKLLFECWEIHRGGVPSFRMLEYESSGPRLLVK